VVCEEELFEEFEAGRGGGERWREADANEVRLGVGEGEDGESRWEGGGEVERFGGTGHGQVGVLKGVVYGKTSTVNWFLQSLQGERTHD
jgi:hypothetical protein